MKSLYAGILIAMLATLSLSLLIFLLISDHLQKHALYPVFEAMDELELQDARAALERGGPGAVSAYMDRLNHLFGVSHYLLDAHGIDIASGRNRSSLLPRTTVTKSRGYVNRRLIITHRSTDGRYWFVAVDPRQPNRWTFLPYYLLVIGVTAVLCWVAALGVVFPVRKITAALDQFGQGDLSARITMRRQDEIGALAQSFDAMAERIQTLLVSQRRLLQDISHELRSPLARLKFAVTLTRTNPDCNLALDRVQKEVDRIASLTSELVELTRAEGDPSAHKAEQVDLAATVAETVSDCRIEAESRGCSIETQGEISGLACGDRELLRRAIENVLRNAIRYSLEGSPVHILLSVTALAATISIRDFGPGVPEHALADIFEPFFQVEESRTAGSTGLGLSIAKRAVQVHKGTITARNSHPGLRVEIVIPLSADVEQLSTIAAKSDLPK